MVQGLDKEIFYELVEQARQRHNVETIEPLPHRHWDECIVLDHGWYMLHYHVEGDKSSKCVIRRAE